MPNLTAIAPQTQPKTNCQSLIASATNHIQTAWRITDVDDMRYFEMSDLQQVRSNLFLALELLAVLKQK